MTLLAVVLRAALALMVVLPAVPIAGAQQDTAATRPDCERFVEELKASYEGRVRAWAQRIQEFEAKLAADREAFAKEPRTAEEQKAFAQRQNEQRAAFYKPLWAEFLKAAAQVHQDYNARCSGYEAQAWKGWSKPVPPVPEMWQGDHAPQASPRPACDPYGGAGGARADGTTASTQPAQGEAAAPAATNQRLEAHTSYPDLDGDGVPDECPPPRSAECASLEDELRARLHRFMAGLAEEKRVFFEQQAKERRDFAAREHSEAEARAFAERQAQAAFEREKAWGARLEAEQRDIMASYQGRCQPQPAYGDRPAQAQPVQPAQRPECAAEVQGWERARMAFEEERRAKRQAFEAGWRERFEAFQAGAPTEEQWLRFKEEASKARTAFEEEMRSAYEAWDRGHKPGAGCAVVLVASAACDPERMRVEAGEFERHLRERYLGASADTAAFQHRLDARFAALAAEWKERRAAFLAQERSAEEHQDFEAGERAAWDEARKAAEAERAAFEARVRAAGQELEQRLRAEMEQFLRSQSERCWGKAHAGEAAGGERRPEPMMPPPPRVAKVVEAHVQHEERRVSCILEVRVQLQEFQARQLRELAEFLGAGRPAEDLRRFEAAQDGALEAFESRVQRLRAACEDELRAQHEAILEERRSAPPRERLGSFTMEMDEERGQGKVVGAHVAFTGDTLTETLQGYTVHGQLFLDAIRPEGGFQDFDIGEEAGASVLTLKGEGFRLRFHDNPTGLLAIKVREGSVELDVADYLRVEQTARGVELSDGERRALLVGPGLEVDGDRVTVRGEAHLFLQQARQEVLDKVANRHRGDLERAAEERRLGAEVTIVASEGSVEAQQLAYDDMTITVEKPREAGKLSVRIDHPEHEGKTVVLNVDKGLLASLSGLQVKVFEVAGAGETDAKALKASSLADVLDPSDDEAPEYWTVTDEDGVQVLVSFPHFSEKRVEIQSTGSGGSKGPLQAVPGFEALLMLGALGACAAIARRRA